MGLADRSHICRWILNGMQCGSVSPARHLQYCFLTAMLLLTGCGSSNRAGVTGLVTLDGKPLEGGVIGFFPAKGNKGPTAGAVITNGRYEINAAKGVPVGANRVNIKSMQKTGRKIPGPRGETDELANVVPPGYNTDSTLVCDIQPGSNELNFELKGRVPIETIRRIYPGIR